MRLLDGLRGAAEAGCDSSSTGGHRRREAQRRRRRRREQQRSKDETEGDNEEEEEGTTGKKKNRNRRKNKGALAVQGGGSVYGLLSCRAGRVMDLANGSAKRTQWSAGRAMLQQRGATQALAHRGDGIKEAHAR